MIIVSAYILSCCAIVQIIDFLIYCIYYREKFSQCPLGINTFDGSNQPYHPSVLYFENGWNGFRYWMVETPYPINGEPYRDRWECPTIHVSNDGVRWTFINKMPIDDISDEEIANRDFLSDPHLVFVGNRIECFYRISHRVKTGFHTCLLRKVTFDGVEWGERELIADFEEDSTISGLGDMVRSQAIIFQDERYKMWYVDGKKPDGLKHVCYSESRDGRVWTKKQVCVLSGKEITPWHIDVNYINGIYVLTIYDFYELTIWIGDTHDRFKFYKTLLKPSGYYGSFYSDGLYRSSLLADDRGFKIYFSAYTESKTSIGLLQGSSLDAMKIYSESKSPFELKETVISYLKRRKLFLWRIKQIIKSYI